MHMRDVQYRWGVYKNIRQHIDSAEGGMERFTAGYKHYGLNRGEHEGRKGIWYREWAPGAQVRCHRDAAMRSFWSICMLPAPRWQPWQEWSARLPRMQHVRHSAGG